MAESIIFLGRVTTVRVGAGALVYLTAVMGYLVADVLELAGNEARDNKKLNILPNINTVLLLQNTEKVTDSSLIVLYWAPFTGTTLPVGGLWHESSRADIQLQA
uniref:Uncharacterized protein n=1 Tax=Timema shepardi TaxID=629360 RepID=A0A7R9G1P6_TIMSH|nr:unnamed protein product [Timema shepardi]